MAALACPDDLDLLLLTQLRDARQKETARASPQQFIPQAPTSRQAEFLALDCLEAFYGGAAGGGKSSALLMGALSHAHVPGYSALLLRRTYADLALPGAIMDRSHAWLRGTSASWNGTDKRWTFPSGATLTFGYLDNEKDRFRYQGAELQFIGFDELTQFPEHWYRYLLSRLRRLVGMPVKPCARGAGNPGGVGHDWVGNRFVHGDGSRPFISAKLDDNPHVDAVAYREALAQLDSITRRQLELGEWVRDVGGLVYVCDDKRNIIGSAPALTYYIIGIDYGFTDATAFSVVGWRDGDPNVYVVESYKRTGMTPSAAAEEALALSRKYSPIRIVGDIGGLGKGYAEEARARFQLPIEAAEKNNKRGYQSLFNGDLERARVRVVLPMCEALVAEWSALVWTEDRRKEAGGFDNHCSDATLYAWRACCAFLEREPTTPKILTQQEADALEAKRLIEARAEALSSEKPWWDT